MYMIFILLTLLVLDAIYLGIHSTFLKETMERIQGPIRVRYLPAAFVYVCLTLLVYKLIQYRVSDLDVFLLGACVYGIYEGTNYAVFRGWPLYLFIADTLWGGILLYLTVRFNRV
jgi:uncharacterized membrane protein